MDRALITGRLGLVGSRITDELVQHGVEVVILDDLSRERRSNADRSTANGCWPPTRTVSEGIFNAAGGSETSLLELADTLTRAMDSDLPVQQGPPRRTNGVVRRRARTSRPRRGSGLRAEIALEHGLGTLVDWLQAQPSEVVGTWK